MRTPLERSKHPRRSLVVALALTASVAACAASPAIGSNVRTEDLSARDHRVESVEHREAADQHAEHQRDAHTARGPVAPLPHADDAHAHEQEAQAHQRAAAALEAGYRAACAAYPPAEHPRCAIEGRRVVAVTDVPGGVRLGFAPGGPDAAATLARAECTHRYADFSGREALATCALAVRDVTLRTETQGSGVLLTLTTAHEPSVPDLRRRAHAMFDPR